MKILVTGHNGYIGAVLVQLLQGAGHEVVGLDTYWFSDCHHGPAPADPPALRMDLRDVTAQDLEGFDAVMHLAALSNDPLGDLSPEYTFDINLHASVQLAEAAKAAGVPRFIFSSSCSLYGAPGTDELVDETAAFGPITPYGVSKIKVEQQVAALADDDFSPTYLRNTTAYGWSPQLRGDIVVNNLVAYAFTTGEVLIKSDGSPWRPLVHVEDIARAFLAVAEAPRAVIHNQAFNVGRTDENYQISAVADLVAQVVPNSRVVYAPGGEPDTRSYRVDFSKIADALPDARPRWTVLQGIEELYEAYQKYGLTLDEFENRYLRIRHLRRLLADGRLTPSLRWRSAEHTAQVGSQDA
ncbi:MAG: NAD(P)-dependent oxidoreductase [Actinobacteria bacterium]|nr:NAD(P)-dependent oxidoreductase [Actinomycetota bacterium]